MCVDTAKIIFVNICKHLPPTRHDSLQKMSSYSRRSTQCVHRDAQPDLALTMPMPLARERRNGPRRHGARPFGVAVAELPHERQRACPWFPHTRRQTTVRVSDVDEFVVEFVISGILEKHQAHLSVADGVVHEFDHPAVRFKQALVGLTSV